MKTSTQWIAHFELNATKHRVDWSIPPSITPAELAPILRSLQAWQLGETSDGSHLLRTASNYANRIKDPSYITAVQLFIKEEQKHGNNLGRYLDAIHQPRVKSDWGDTLFRKCRYFNTSMDFWTLTVLTVESAAQIFYQSLKDASNCTLLKQICTDILIDEAPHIEFQKERLAILFRDKFVLYRPIWRIFYQISFFSIAVVVWLGHRKLFRAGGNTFSSFIDKMTYKYHKTIARVTSPVPHPRYIAEPSLQPETVN
jgi:hypothetical protein